MAGQGAGPSRRSHTKSRKGCKTCKRRHIRCDETFPQCRNCTKHQVQCDYMENLGSEAEGQSSPEQPSILLTPGSESRIDQWQQTGGFPWPELQVFPPPPTQEYSKNDLRLIHHLSAITKDLMMKGTSHLTMWTQKMPKFLSIASTYPFVMHALLSFSANHLAWANSSTDCRNLHIQHGSTALRGLHDAIGEFSPRNADAVLTASLLMLWQATDWRSWSSLRAGIQSVLSTMQSWKHESVFTEYIAEEDLFAASFQTHRRRQSVSSNERNAVLQNTIHALQRLRLALAGNDEELRRTNELLEYVQRLQSIDPPASPEEQFQYLYYLRKWLFWVPISLLQQRGGGQGPALMTIAHFYSTALDLEPLFPDLGSSFCAALALPPLEAIFSITGTMQVSQPLTPALQEILSMMQYPQHVALNYRSRAMLSQTPIVPQIPPTTISPDALSYTTVGNLSPAFVPSPLHTSTPQSGSSYSFLEVPTPSNTGGFGYGTQNWGVAPSPGYPAGASPVYGMPGEHASYSGFRAGLVTSPEPIWT